MLKKYLEALDANLCTFCFWWKWMLIKTSAQVSVRLSTRHNFSSFFY